MRVLKAKVERIANTVEQLQLAQAGQKAVTAVSLPPPIVLPNPTSTSLPQPT